MSQQRVQLSLNRRDAGTTLIEVVVALTITALLTAAAAPSVGRALERTRVNGSTRALIAALKATRLEARTSGVETLFVLDVHTGTYRVGWTRDGVLPVSADATVTLLTSENERLGEHAGAIRFFPDGSSSGGTITLTHSGREYRIEVDWLTGQVRAVTP